MMRGNGQDPAVRIGFYSHDTLGLGHFSRCLKIAHTFARGLGRVEGVLITGLPCAGVFQAPPGHRLVRLPAVTKRGDGTYVEREAGASLARVLAERCARISTTIKTFAPDLFIVDNVPCGLGGEVLPSLRHLAARRGVRTVLVLRDVLDSAGVIKDEWERGEAGEALEIYDEIWVFGSRADVEAMVESGPLGTVASKVVACGALPSPPSARRETPGLLVECDEAPGALPVRSAAQSLPTEESSGEGTSERSRPRIIVTGGGGKDAHALVRSYLDALRMFRPAVSSRIVLGPDFPEETLRELTAHNGFEACIDRFVPDLAAEIAQADAVVSMAGYNTVCEVRAAGCPALLVPRVRPRREQWLRACALAEVGLVKVEHPEAIDARSLWLAVEELLESPAPRPQALPGGHAALARAGRLLGTEPRQPTFTESLH